MLYWSTVVPKKTEGGESLAKSHPIGIAGLAVVFFWAGSASADAADLAGHKFLVTSARTGDTEIFVVDPATGDAIDLSRSPKSEDRYPLNVTRQPRGLP
jgi:hypothetical protein